MTVVDVSATAGDAQDLTGIVQVCIPVTDLARSAAWYRDLLGLSHAHDRRDGRPTAAGGRRCEVMAQAADACS
jgi:catechol-2,3-dioxygenase